MTSSSGAESISTNDIENIVDRLRNQRHRGSTQRSYYSIWKAFNKFFIKLDRKPDTWGERLTLFVGYLIDCKKQSSTVRSYISAIKAVLKTNNIDVKEDEFLLSSLTRACRLNNDVFTARLPVSKGLLGILIRRISKTYLDRNQHYMALLMATILCMAYYGLFRIGELTWTKSGHVPTRKSSCSCYVLQKHMYRAQNHS